MGELSNGDRLAFERTSLANDRTLLAWIRTAIGIIGFGFTFYKFFEYLSQQEGFKPHHQMMGPRGYAILLIAWGTVTLLLATLQYYHARRDIKRQYAGISRTFAPLLALFVVLTGGVLMYATWMRL